MVVDDSAIVRGLISRMLNSDPDITVVASVANGEMAISSLKRTPVDVVILDIEMPVMDGLTALPLLLEIDKDLKVLMASTLTNRNADISIRALTMGAADYVPKPTSSREIGGKGDFQRELLEKVKTLGDARRKRAGRVKVEATTGKTPFKSAMPSSSDIKLRAPGRTRPSVLAIGSSTGGPQALFKVLGGLPKDFQLPIVITQHMPPTFTSILSEHIEKASKRPCNEGKDGTVIAPGSIYIAPGDYHMTVEKDGANKVLRLNQGPKENFCRPAVDPMLRSMSQAYGPNILTVILTGMGSDGTKGGQTIVDNGGTLIAQDEESSVVWGMPGSVATAGLCSVVVPIDDIASKIVSFASRGIL
ncbi:MAG: chemotaxis response regulator protein-glutamate methylesterase [Rhodospirillaceae bacterium]|nr:chemotaxis response regulator protein-glutamate methylesterase [Rhodospirillales bacterium]MBT3906677.1 chemotaxis response regulator protein-glutamate methylesterase [Rhodospirillaceae bacterium]MBT4702557.1 chemotaxis response regulator protein-glutamate methylesterase [Rhodospirillaceae bacterium]MBT5033733.1 chemotaxis response regulator protein-glutamate methylesterase [Rhodospirillaceae bacterium]MBT6221913.1 chemotaxis response regulator protein-glutamate methylesterase [Rhodospirilla